MPVKPNSDSTTYRFILRDPRLWGDDANEFRPERFLSEHNPRAKDLPDVESIGFGFGRR
jgi:cytochrome P450